MRCLWHRRRHDVVHLRKYKIVDDDDDDDDNHNNNNKNNCINNINKYLFSPYTRLAIFTVIGLPELEDIQ